MKEYCESCRLPLREWEWSGRGFCEMCEDKMIDRLGSLRNTVSESDERWQDFRNRLIESLQVKGMVTESVVSELLDAARVASSELNRRSAAVATMQEISRCDAAK